MVDGQDVEKAIRQLYAQPLANKPHYFHPSQIWFCMKKQLMMMRDGDGAATNGAMVSGKIHHAEMIPKLVATIPALKNKKWVLEQDMEYWDEERQIGILAHPDAMTADDKSYLVEFKTTDVRTSWNEDSPMLSLYAYQINCYLNIRQVPIGDIWVYYKRFADITKERFVSTYSVPRSLDDWNKTLDRCKMIDTAFETNNDLTGPEFDWECAKCSKILKCSIWKDIIPMFEHLLPAPNLDALRPNLDMEKVCKVYKKNGWIKFDKDDRQWVKVNPSEVDLGEINERMEQPSTDALADIIKQLPKIDVDAFKRYFDEQNNCNGNIMDEFTNDLRNMLDADYTKMSLVIGNGMTNMSKMVSDSILKMGTDMAIKFSSVFNGFDGVIATLINNQKNMLDLEQKKMELEQKKFEGETRRLEMEVVRQASLDKQTAAAFQKRVVESVKLVTDQLLDVTKEDAKTNVGKSTRAK